MTRSIAVLVAGLSLFSAVHALAQDQNPGPGTLEVTVSPGGATYFTSKDDAPGFNTQSLNAAVTFNINRVIGVEGEVGGSLGIDQDFTFSGVTGDRTSPDSLNYSGNLVVSVPTSASVVPYVTAGAGALTMFKRERLGIDDRQTLLIGNAGGGLRWYASNGHWGVRGDYRFTATRRKDDAPAFFGRETRFGHRIYAGVIINAVR